MIAIAGGIILAAIVLANWEFFLRLAGFLILLAIIGLMLIIATSN